MAKRLPGEDFVIRLLQTKAGPLSIFADGSGPADQVLRADDGILNTNVTTRLNGLAMEMARPWILRSTDKRIPAMFDCTQEALRAAMAAAAAGRPISGIHAAARKVFERAGYDVHYMMRACHGIGVIQHDFPVDAPFDDRPLLENETYALEPSLYVQGVGVFRFADTIAVTPCGAESLTRATRERAELTLR
jgi:Xaa-Pro dipeptidase